MTEHMTKAQLRRLASIVREELRYLERAIKEGDLEWAQIHAQQAAGIACTLEEHVFTYTRQQQESDR